MLKEPRAINQNFFQHPKRVFIAFPAFSARHWQCQQRLATLVPTALSSNRTLVVSPPKQLANEIEIRFPVNRNV